MTVIATACSVVASCSGTQQSEKWAEEMIKGKNITLEFHPSTDFVELQRQFEAAPELWNAAFDYLATKCEDLDSINEFGNFPIVGEDCYVALSQFTPAPNETIRLEGHKKYVDIQVCQGPVNWGVCNTEATDLVSQMEYNPDRDCLFATSPSTTVYCQPAGKPYVFVFFPDDLHAPSYAVEGAEYPVPVKKICIKVKNTCL